MGSKPTYTARLTTGEARCRNGLRLFHKQRLLYGFDNRHIWRPHQRHAASQTGSSATGMTQTILLTL